MNVRILKDFAQYKAGQEVDVSEKLAARYCESGRAQACGTDADDGDADADDACDADDGDPDATDDE